MNVPTDDRGQWPSASAFEANSLCPGRHVAQQALPELPQDPDAESGQAIHAAWAGKAIRALTDEEDETYRVFREREHSILCQWTINSVRGFREKRLWHEWSKGEFVYRFSGQADVIYLDPPRALVLDGKRGRKSVTAEPSNLQLRTLAALVSLHGIELCGQAITEVTVALVQHWNPSSPPCIYNAEDLTRARNEMAQLVESWYVPDAKRTPNRVSCEYCRAKGTCPEFAAAGLPVPFKDGHVIDSEDLSTAILSLDGRRLGTFTSLCALALDCAKAEVRKRLELGNKVDGWCLSPGRTTETVIDPQELFNRFVLSGGKTEDFLKTIKVVKEKFKLEFKKLTGSKGEILERELNRVLDGITESKTSQPILERE